MDKQYFIFTLLFFTLQTTPSFSSKSDKIFAFVLSDSLVPYLKIQKDLANDDFSVVRETATTWAASLKAGLNINPENKTINDLLITLQNFSKTEKHTQIRIQFGKISQVVIGYLKVHPIENKHYQLFFCPMFPQGYAFWIQSKKEGLSNPYWGKEMLTCGVRRNFN
ncbi:MAG: DUF3347 domain-containing protein [Bdellovibrionales bacterium]|nr:DUF3347 domain-containing protein [Bdellovibrionales bacterium]